MAISKVRVGESQERLMLAIGDAIRVHTTTSPMTIEQIAGVVAFCAGAAIARGSRNRNHRRQLREMATANIDFGMEAMASSISSSSLILPEGVQ